VAVGRGIGEYVKSRLQALRSWLLSPINFPNGAIKSGSCAVKLISFPTHISFSIFPFQIPLFLVLSVILGKKFGGPPTG